MIFQCRYVYQYLLLCMSHSYNSLYNYLCLLYSQPTYEDKKDKQKIFRLYNDLFSEQKNIRMLIRVL